MDTGTATQAPVSQHGLPQLIRDGRSDTEIERLLEERYHDDFLVKNLMKEVKKLRNARRTSAGLMLVLAGAVTLLLSCVLTLTGGYSAGTFGIFLFGFTTLGIVIVFAGLIKIFG